MLVTGYKGTAFVSEKIEYSKIGYIMTGDNCPHRTIFGKTPEKLRRDYGAFTDVFDRKKEYLFSYAMNDDITQEIMARCKKCERDIGIGLEQIILYSSGGSDEKRVRKY